MTCERVCQGSSIQDGSLPPLGQAHLPRPHGRTHWGWHQVLGCGNEDSLEEAGPGSMGVGHAAQ